MIGLEHLFIDESGRAPSKGTAIARVAVVTCILLVPLVIGLIEVARAWRMDGYQRAAGTVVSSELVQDDTGFRDAPYGVQFRAMFNYAGRGWIGVTSVFGTKTSDAASADRERRRHPAGDAVEVWFQPSRLPEIVIDRPNLLGRMAFVGGVIVLFLFVSWVYFAPTLTRAWNPQLPKPRRLKVGFRLIFLAGFAATLLGLYFMVIKPLWLTFLARNWLQGEATILDVHVLEDHSQVTLWSTDVLYAYQVRGQRYISNVYNLTECKTPNAGPRRRAVAKYTQGDIVPCYFDPDDPGNATLTRHVSPSIGISSWLILLASLSGTLGSMRDPNELDQIPKQRTGVIIGAIILVVTVGSGIALLGVP